MAHRVLALKYRPQVFSDLVGQEHVSMVLARAIEGGRVAHAYLFAGARGVGKTTSARILAKALNCQRRAAGTRELAARGGREAQGAQAGAGRTASAEPCNACTSCTEITAGVSLDVAEIDGASNRGIADVQVLREKVRFTPTGGRYRVVIIDEVHQLSNDAFAALLKTLEEPPEHLVFIFATTDPQKVPETIRSRTQRFDFARVPLRKVAGRLQDIAAREQQDPEGLKFVLTEGAALLIAQKSEGSIRDAVSALDQVVSSGEATIDDDLVRRVLGIPDREAFFALVGAIVRRDPRGALTALHEAFAKGLDPGELAQGLTEHIRHLLVLKVDPEAAELVPATSEELGRLREQAAEWSEHDLMRLMKLASDLGWPMRDSAQPLIHLEAAVMQMATLEAGETLAALLARLEALEKRLGGEPGAEVPGRSSSPAARPPQSAGALSPSPPAPARTGPPASGPAAAPGSRPARTPPSASAAPARSFSSPPAASAGSAPSMSAPRAAAAAVIDGEPPTLDEDTLRRWETTVEAVNASKRMLGAFLQESRFVGVTARGLLLAMDDLHRSVVDEPANRGLVETHAAAAFGRPLALQCLPLDPGEAPRGPQNVDVRPLVERAKQWFEGDPIRRPGSEAGRSDG